jgi:hypothetical protein
MRAMRAGGKDDAAAGVGSKAEQVIGTMRRQALGTWLVAVLLISFFVVTSQTSREMSSVMTGSRNGAAGLRFFR